MTPWLVKRLSGCDAAWVSPGTPIEHYLVTGSVLNWSSKHSVAWGPGLASWRDEVTGDADIRAVRGPLSLMRARSCGWNGNEREVMLADPALLMPKFVPGIDKNGLVGVIPHYVDMARFSELDDKQVRSLGCVIIDPLLPVEEFCKRVSACREVVSSSLHGLIVADAYGVPNAWAKFGDGIGGDGMKYWDYMLSVKRATWDMPPKFTDYRNRGAVQTLESVGAAKPGLAPRDLVLEKQEQLLESCPFNKLEAKP